MMAFNSEELCVGSTSHGVKDSEEEKLPILTVSPIIGEDVSINVSDDICNSMSRHSGIRRPQQRSQSAKLIEKDTIGHHSSPNVPHSTKSITVPSETGTGNSFSEIFDKIRQDLGYNMGHARDIREPVIAWGAEDSRETSLSVPKRSGAGRGDSQSSRQRPSSYSEDSANSNRQLPSSHEDCSEKPQRGSETLLDDNFKMQPQDSKTNERKPKDIEKGDVPNTTSERSKHLRIHIDKQEEKEDDNSASSPPASPTSRAGELFEDHTGTIQDFHDFLNNQSPKHHSPSSVQASSTFQETMVDLFGYPDYSHPPPRHSISQIASRTMRVTGALGRFFRSRRAGTQAGGDCVQEMDQLTVDNAQRGWRALRTYLQDQSVSKRTSQSALSWNMLRHTVKGITTDQDKTRQDLYKRYGIIPSQDANGNITMENTMLSDRARKTSTGTRHTGSTRTVTTRSPERGEPARSGVWITSKRQNPQTKYLSSSLPSMFSSPSSSSKVADDQSSQRGGRPGMGRGRRVGVVRPHSSVWADTAKGAGSGDGGGGGSGLLPLRKISEPAFRASRSLDL